MTNGTDGTSGIDRDSQAEMRRRILDAGLHAFDDAVGRRRRRRRGAAVALLALAAAAILSLPGRGPTLPSGPSLDPIGDRAIARRPLPLYVEVIADDQRLQVELELASACERVGRTAGRLYVIECSTSGGSG